MKLKMKTIEKNKWKKKLILYKDQWNWQTSSKIDKNNDKDTNYQCHKWNGGIITDSEKLQMDKRIL